MYKIVNPTSFSLETYMDYYHLKVAIIRLTDRDDKNIKADKFFKELGL